MGLQYSYDSEEGDCLRLVQLERFLRVDSENTRLESLHGADIRTRSCAVRALINCVIESFYGDVHVCFQNKYNSP